MTRIHIQLALNTHFPFGKESHSLRIVAFRTLIGLMPNRSTYKTRALPIVSAISAAFIAAKSPIVGYAVGKVTLHEIVVVVPQLAPDVVVAPSTGCPTALDC